MSVLTVGDIADWLGVDESKLVAEQAQIAIDAVEEHLAGICDIPAVDGDGAWPADFHLGAVLLVARLRKRAESPIGQIGFDGASIAGFDSDISRMLARYERRAGRFA